MARILHIIGGLSTGGAEMMLFKLLAARRSEGLDHTVITLKDGGSIAERIGELGVSVRSAGMTSALALPIATPRVLHMARRVRPQVIQGWMYHGNIVSLLASRLITPRPAVNWSIRHCIYDLRDEKRGTARLIRLGARWSPQVAKIIYNSKTSMEQHTELGYTDRHSIVIPNGFDCDRFRPSEAARVDLRRELGVGEDTFLIGMVARYHPMKDHATFLKASKELLETHPELRFVLAGTGADAGNNALSHLIESHGLKEHVHALGERSDMPQITAALDVASLSSSSEAFPNVIGEAMACGVPVVATDVGEATSIIGDKGIVVPAGDPDALAAGWRALVERAPDSRRELGLRARERICSHFAIAEIAGRYETLYEEQSKLQQ